MKPDLNTIYTRPIGAVEKLAILGEVLALTPPREVARKHGVAVIRVYSIARAAGFSLV